MLPKVSCCGTHGFHGFHFFVQIAFCHAVDAKLHSFTDTQPGSGSIDLSMNNYEKLGLFSIDPDRGLLPKSQLISEANFKVFI